MSLIFSPGSFFAARARNFTPRASTFKIAAGAFAAGAVLATVASYAPERSRATDTAIPARVITDSTSGAERPSASIETRTRAASETKAARLAEPRGSAADVQAARAPSEIAPKAMTLEVAATDESVRNAIQGPVPSPRAKPEVLATLAAPLPAATDEANIPASPVQADALATLITRLNAAEAAGAPAPETVSLATLLEVPPPSPAMPKPASDDAKPVAAKPAAKRVAGRSLADARAQASSRSLAASSKAAKLARAGERAAPAARPVEARTTPFGSLAELFGGR